MTKSKSEVKQTVIINGDPETPTPIASKPMIGTVDRLTLRFGVGLIRIVAGEKGLLKRITSLRSKLESQFGFGFPKVRLTEDKTLAPNEYRLVRWWR